MFTMVLFDGSVIRTKIFFLSSYASRIKYLYTDDIVHIRWHGGIDYNIICFPNASDEQAAQYANALRNAVQTDDWKIA